MRFACRDRRDERRPAGTDTTGATITATVTLVDGRPLYVKTAASDTVTVQADGTVTASRVDGR